MTDLIPLNTIDNQALAHRAEPLRRDLEECRQERNTALAQLLEVQLESETRIGELQARIRQMDQTAGDERAAHLAEIEALRHAAAERDMEIATLRQWVTAHNDRVETLNHAIAELEQRRRTVDDALAESDGRNAGLKQEVAHLKQQVAERDASVAQLYASSSWRLTAPLRFMKRKWPQVSSRLAGWIRAIYVALPLPWGLKIRLKSLIFALLSPFLVSAPAYQAWVEYQRANTERAGRTNWRRRARPVIADWVRALYTVTPLPIALKMRAKGLIFALFSPVLRDTRAYRAWVEFEHSRRLQPPVAAPAENPQERNPPIEEDAPIETPPPPAVEPDDAAPQVSIEDTESAESAENETGSSTDNSIGSNESSARTLALTLANRCSPPTADGHFEWDDYAATKTRIVEAERLRKENLAPVAPVLMTVAPARLKSAVARIRLPVPVDKPEVSIIIPAYNQAKLTIECLLSISACADSATTFEVLVADDKSTDETAALLVKIPHLKLISGKRNVGFLHNCNHAATYAKGRFLVFLNNDTQVTRGWLSELVKTVREHPDCAVVGPKLIYPTGYLQEAGATLRRDCTTDMIGLNDDPNLPRYNYVREVDYCSGACLLIEASVFRDLGGFDDIYAPAYCEDSDLCLRVRRAGRRVLYCPSSVVVHHLSKSSDEVSSDYKLGCIAKNLQTFSQRWQAVIDRDDDVRLIAFYLPQFHPIPENDVWWGKGFTEWMNVTKARPNFVGHYQPHLPADLGYYDLRVPDVMEHQASLARRYGLHGFCFYYYWFAGRRVLELPLERLLDTGRPDFPFCLCWANENWTRRWDGMDHEILVAQHHSDEDDLAVIKDLCRFFAKPHYIRIDGKPLILVYRVTLFPDFAATAAIWRQYCLDAGIGEIYIAMVESFELVHVETPPSRFGCDAAVEFPPLGMGEPKPPEGEVLNERFTGYIADYRDTAVRYATRRYPDYKRFLGVMPGWDNTPRRQDNGFIFDHSTPGVFQAWMEQTVQRTKAQFVGDERLVFVNAWNEWAEGAHLEPDQRFGHTFLEAALNAKQASSLLRRHRYALG